MKGGRVPMALRVIPGGEGELDDREGGKAFASQGFDDRRFIELDVVGEDRDGVVRPETDLVGDLVGPADDQPIHVREPLRGGERRPAIDDDGLEAEFPRQSDERPGDFHAADDDEDFGDDTFDADFVAARLVYKLLGYRVATLKPIRAASAAGARRPRKATPEIRRRRA